MVYFHGWHVVGQQKDANHEKTPAGGLAYVVEPRKDASMKSHPRWCGFVLGMWLGIGWALVGHRKKAAHKMTPLLVSFRVWHVWEAFMEKVDEEDFLVVMLTVNNMMCQ